MAGYSEDTVRIHWGYSEDTVKQWGYSEGAGNGWIRSTWVPGWPPRAPWCLWADLRLRLQINKSWPPAQELTELIMPFFLSKSFCPILGWCGCILAIIMINHGIRCFGVADQQVIHHHECSCKKPVHNYPELQVMLVGFSHHPTIPSISPPPPGDSGWI